MRYTVYIPEMWYRPVEVDAQDEAEARAKAKAEQLVREDESSFSHQLADGEVVVPAWEVEIDETTIGRISVKE